MVIRLLHYWPRVDSVKEGIFLEEVEDILGVINAKEFAQIQEQLFRQLAKSIVSPHHQVALRALSFWNNERFCILVKDNITAILPIMFTSIYQNSKSHWNKYYYYLFIDVLIAHSINAGLSRA